LLCVPPRRIADLLLNLVCHLARRKWIIPPMKNDHFSFDPIASSIARRAQDTMKLAIARTSGPVRARSRAQRPPKQNPTAEIRIGLNFPEPFTTSRICRGIALVFKLRPLPSGFTTGQPRASGI
jgi:hypothetical protein